MDRLGLCIRIDANKNLVSESNGNFENSCTFEELQTCTLSAAGKLACPGCSSGPPGGLDLVPIISFQDHVFLPAGSSKPLAPMPWLQCYNILSPYAGSTCTDC